MNKSWETIKIPLVVADDGAKIVLTAIRTEPQKELQLHRIDPQNDLIFPDTVTKRAELINNNEMVVSYDNLLIIELPDRKDRLIRGFHGQFDSYPTTAVRIIDRIEESVDWGCRSEYPVTLNNFRISRNRRDVPVEILNEGKSMVAAYLFTIHGWNKTEVANMLELSPETIQQYLTNVRTGNR